MAVIETGARFDRSVRSGSPVFPVCVIFGNELDGVCPDLSQCATPMSASDARSKTFAECRDSGRDRHLRTAEEI